MFNPTPLHIPLIKKGRVARGIYSFYFDISKTNFTFFPGQYVKMTLPITATDGRGNSRFLTISSSPHDKKFIVITTKEGPSNFKKKLFSTPIGHVVELFGPFGGFYFREHIYDDHIFISGGIGITPFWSMIQFILQHKFPHNVTLFASHKSEDQLLFHQQLLHIAQLNSSFRYIPTLTTEEHSSWNGNHGRITEQLLKHHISDLSKPIYFIVGSLTMVSNVESTLIAMGIASDHIRLEQFTGY